LAGRYAYGWGPVPAFLFSEDTEARPRRASLRAHALAFNLGGAVTF
jgi:hypothetical protein